MVRCSTALVCFALLFGSPGSAHARQDAEQELTNLFFDCQAPGCGDLDYLRREVGFVNWVRDREAADVHVLVTSQPTGGGGRQYTIDFIGLAAFAGDDRRLALSTSGDATTDEQRNGIAERLGVGLVAYVTGTTIAERLRVQLVTPEGGDDDAAATQEDDPWDFWSFRLSADGFINGEATSRFSNTFSSVQANRTTDAWKIDLRANFSQNVQEFEYEDEDGEIQNVREVREDWSTVGSVVRSLGAQWAAGVLVEGGRSTFLNEDYRLGIKPGIEYNFVPYAQSSRRALTLQYLIGPNHWNYSERTIFGQAAETRVQHSITGRISLIEPWGRWNTSVTTSQYLHDPEKYNVTVSGNVNVRLFRGFSVRIGGRYSWIRDQLFLPGAGATEEEILLRQRQLATSYRYFTSFGIEYRFGSIFNNVVNPRFGPGGGEVFIG